MTINLTTINITQWTDDLINSTQNNISIIIFAGNYSDVENEEQQRFQPNSVPFIVTTSIVLSILTICTVIGNILVMAAVLLERHLRTPANYLVLSLALADCLVACLVMPFGAYSEIQGQWLLGVLLCEFWISVDVLCCTASILHLLAIAIDRYWAVTNIDYIQNRNAKRIGFMIMIIWSVAAIIALAPNFGWKDPEFKTRINLEKRCLVSQDISYQIFATVTTFYGPLIFILVLYWKIYKVARKRIRRKPGKLVVPVSNAQTPRPLAPISASSLDINITNNVIEVTEMSQFNDNLQAKPILLANTTLRLSPNKSSTTNGANTNPSSSSNHKTNSQTNIIANKQSKKTVKETIESKRERKAAKTLAIITGVFVMCWLPFFVVALLMSICTECEPNKYVFGVFQWLGYLNSLLNPIIYTIFSPDFRNGFRRILCGRKAGSNRRVNR